MIELTWATAFLLYLLAALFSLFALWLKAHFDQKKRKIVLSRQLITVCEFCQNPYISLNGESLTRCPLCKSINKLK